MVLIPTRIEVAVIFCGARHMLRAPHDISAGC